MGKQQNKKPKTTANFDTMGNPPKGNGFIQGTKHTGFSVFENNNVPSIVGYEKGSTNFIDTSAYTEYTEDVNRGVSAFPFQSDYEKSRAVNQSGWQQTGRALTRLVPNTMLEFAGMVGNTLDFEDYANTDNEVGNWLNTWAQEQKAKINEALPIYRENPGKALDIGDSAWWVESGGSLVESAAAFVGLGYLTGGLGLGALSKGGKALEWLKLIGKGATASNKGQKALHVLSGLSNTLMLNQAEGIGIATQVYDTAYKQAVEDLTINQKDSNPKQIEQQAKQIAADKAATAINYNRSNMLLNMTSAFAFLKTPLTTRSLINKPSVGKSLKTAGLEGIQESGEELVNMLSEKAALDDNYGYDKAMKDVISMEGLESAILGFVGGAGQTALTNAGREVKLRKDDEGKRISENDRLRQKYSVQQDLIKRWDALGKEGKFADGTDAYLKSKEAWVLHNEINDSYSKLDEAIKSENKSDIDKYVAEVKDKQANLLTNQAYDAFSTGTTEQLLSVFEDTKKLTKEEAEQKGLDGNTYVEQSDDAIKLITSLEKEYNKSRSYINGEDIYKNRARTFELRNRSTKLENAKELALQDVQSDLADLNIKEDTLEYSEKGRITFKNMNKYGQKKKDALKNLESLELYNGVLNNIDKVAKQKENLATQYSTLTSSTTQDKLKQSIKDAKQKTKQDIANKKISKKQEENTKKKEAAVTQHKEATTVEETTEEAPTKPTIVTEETPTTIKETPVKDNTKATDFKFNFAQGLEAQQDNFNKLLTNKKVPLEKKLEALEQGISVFEQQIGMNPTAAVPFRGAIAQLNQAKEALNKTEEENVASTESGNVAMGNAKDLINKLKDNLDQDDSIPAVKEEQEPSERTKKTAERVHLIGAFLDTIESAGVDIQNFPLVAMTMSDLMGRDSFVKYYNVLKDLYNLSHVNKNRVEDTYESIFFTDDYKNQIVNTSELLDAKLVLSEIYALSDNEFDDLQKNLEAALLEEQGYTVYDKDKITVEGAKVVTAHNKVAYLGRNYVTDINGRPIKFNVLDFLLTKKDAENTINKNLDERVLDYNFLNEGSEITFVPLDEVHYADGTIAYKDGTIEKDGITTKEDALEAAPIAISYNGEIIKGLYLHLPKWINESTIANPADVKTQQDFLRTIRKAVLESNKPVKTTIRKRGDGWLIKDKDNKFDKVSKRLPKVELGIGKDGMVFESTVSAHDVVNKEIVDGVPYAVVPVNKDRHYALPLKPARLKNNAEYVDSIINAVELYLNNNTENYLAKQLLETTNIDITSIKGLKTYIEKFVYLNNSIDRTVPNAEKFKFDDFKNLVNKLPSDKSIIRVTGGTQHNIEFGRGKNVGDTTRFINRDILNRKVEGETDEKFTQRRSEELQTLLNKLRNVLENNTFINVNKEHFGTELILPIIKDNEVVVEKTPYNDFIKENTYTNYHSHKLENGEYRYTVQSNLDYDVTFAFQPQVEETVAEETEIPTTVNEDGQITVDFEGDSINLDPTSFGDLDDDFAAPKESLINKTIYEAWSKSKGVDNDFSNVEFIKLYRAEGKTAEESKLPKAVAGNTGTWFTPNKSEGERYARMGNRLLYELDVPKALYENIRKAKTNIAEQSKGEVNLPKDLAILKQLVTNILPAPKELSSEEAKEFAATIPSSLLLDGVNLHIQTAVIDYLSAKIIRQYNLNKDKTNTSQIVRDFRDSLLPGMITNHSNFLHQYKGDKENKAFKTIDNNHKNLIALKDQFPKLEKLLLDNLRTYSNLKVSGEQIKQLQKNIEEDKDFTIDEETGQMVFNYWNDNAIFKEDARKKVSVKVKNYFDYIEDVKGFKYENGKRIAIKKTGYLNLPSVILFDRVINELSGILAYSNYDNTKTTVKPNLDNMVEVLEEWVETKPYLHNVIKRIQDADETIKNQFVSLMSKHYTHHLYLYESKKGKSFINTSDNNTIVNIIQNKWLNNIFESNLIKEKDNALIVNKEEVDKIDEKVKEVVNSLKTKEEILAINDAKELFDMLGFKIPKKALMDINKGKLRIDNIPQNLIGLLTNKGGAFNVYINTLKSLVGKDAQETNVFSNNSALNKFTRQYGKLYPAYFANSFKDVRGENYWGYSSNKFLIDRIKRLKSDDNLLQNLLKQPFSITSHWVKQLLYNPTFKKHFSYYTFDGTSKEGEKGKKLSDMSVAEIEKTKLTLYHKMKGDLGIVNLFYPTTSDKSIQYIIKTLSPKPIQDLTLVNKRLQNNTIDWLYSQLALPEINRILDVQDNYQRYNVKNYKEGGTMFNMLPALNGLKSIWVTEKDGTRKLNTNILNDAKLQQDIKNSLKEYINVLVDVKLQKWEKYGFTENKEEQVFVNAREFYKKKTTLLNTGVGKPIDAHVAAHKYVLDYLVANTNVYQTFTTDPAFYWKSKQWKTVAARVLEQTGEVISKREQALDYYSYNDWVQEHEDLFDNMGKRLASEVAPGVDIADSDTSILNVVHVNDSERKSIADEYIKAIVGEGYGNMETTDAQEFTTLKEHLFIMNKQGIVTTKQMKDLLDKEKSGTKLSDAELRIVLQPVKPVYVNNYMTEGIEHRLYIKSSSFPLFKQLTKGLEIDKVRVAMEKQDIDRLAFSTAIKVGQTRDAVDIYDENGNVLNNIKFDTIRTIPRQGFKIQQDNPYEESKDYINDGTQQRKLLTASVRTVKGFVIPNNIDSDISSYTGQGIQDEIDKAYKNLFEAKYKELKDEIGFDLYTGNVNMKKLQRILEDEAVSRQYPLYDIEGLKLIRNDKDEENFLVPLWLSSVSGKFEAMLNSVVDNRIRKFKPKGKSYILGTSEGFTPKKNLKEGKEAEDYIKNTTGIVFSKDWKGRKDGYLLPQRIEDANGKLYGEEGFEQSSAVVKPAEVILPFKFKDEEGNLLNVADFMTKDGMIDMDKMDESLLKMFAFRIPTQGLNSMASVKVVGFLPTESGDLFLAPADWTAQMGSDFDVDKVFTNSYNTTYNEGKLGLYLGDDIEKQTSNRLLDLHFAVLDNPSISVQKEILKPLEFGKLPQMINEIYPLIEDRVKGVSISEDYQSFKYLNARAGKAGIGVFSTDSTFLASMQGKDIELQQKIERNGKAEYIDYNFELGGHISNQLSSMDTNARGTRTKMDVIAAFQSLSVDNENEQGMHKLNINSNTFDAIRTLALKGFEEDVITYMINQPIIRRLVELEILAKDDATTFNYDEVETTLEEEFPVDESVEDMTNEVFMNMYGRPSLDLMKSQLNGQVDNNTQRALYKLFKNFSRYGKQIQGIQSAINTDSAGLGKDLFFSTAKENQILTLSNKVFMRGADELIGNYLTLEYGLGHKQPDHNNPLLLEWYNNKLSKKRKLEILKELEGEGYIPVTTVANGRDIQDKIQLIQPTTINGLTSVYALLFNNRVWERFYPYSNTTVVKTITDLKKVTKQEGGNVRENADVDKVVFSGIKSFLASKFSDKFTDGEIISERERLSLAVKGNTSLASIVKSLRESRKLNNPFINRLEFDFLNGIEPDRIKYRAHVAENLNERTVYASLSSMLIDNETDLGTFNDIKYTPRKVAQDLITEQMLSGGVQKSNQFIKYIPINYLKTIGFYDDIDNVNLHNEDEFNGRNFNYQYIQHNPRRVELSKKDIDFTLKQNHTFYNDATIIRKTGGASSLPRIFSIPNKKASKKYSLYVYNPNSKQYEQVDTLGKADYLEYNSASKFGNTIIPSNKVPEVNNFNLPTDEDGIDKVLGLDEGEKEGTATVFDTENATVSEYYHMDKEETSLQKVNVILDKIIDRKSNKFNSLIAREIKANLDKIKDIKLVIDSGIDYRGLYKPSQNTIYINPSEASDKDAFDDTILEELLHAMLYKPLRDRDNEVSTRLEGLRQAAIEATKKHYGRSYTQRINQLNKKLDKDGTQGYTIPLNKDEADILYPLTNLDEFAGRLFKSKKLQQILNETPSDVEGKSLWEKFKDLINDILNAVGFDIKKGSALEYALSDIMTLIKHPSPSSDITGKLDNEFTRIRTPEYIYKRFGIMNEDGSMNSFPAERVQELVDWVNTNVDNLIARVEGGSIMLDNKPIIDVDENGQTSLFAKPNPIIKYARKATNSYEVSSKGDKRFSALVARLKDGRTIEEAYQLDVKGYRSEGNDWRLGKGKPPKNTSLDVYKEYKKLWKQWSIENPLLMKELRKKAKGKVLTDKFANTSVSQARALAEILNEEDSLFAIKEERNDREALLKSYNNRIERLEHNLDKAEKADDFDRITILTKNLESLVERRNEVLKLSNLEDIYIKGEQDMQELEAIFNRKVSMEDTLYARKIIHFWKSAKDLLFKEDEKESLELIKLFSNLEAQAEKFDTRLTLIEEDYMNKFMKQYGSDLTVSELFNYFKDINNVQSMVLDISRSGNDLLDSVFMSVKEANIDALDETKDILKDLAELEGKIRPVLNDLGHKELFEVYRQRNKDGLLTGHIVNPFTSEFHRKRRSQLKSLKEVNTFANYVKAINWANNNTENINLNYLFPLKALSAEDKVKADAYKDELRDKLGEYSYNRLIVEQQKLIDRYKNYKESFVQWLKAEYNLTTDNDIKNHEVAYKAFNTWTHKNSPYFYTQHLDGKGFKELEKLKNFKAFDFIYHVPKNPQYFDSNFKTIEANKDLLAFYKYYTKVDKQLKQFMPVNDRIKLAFNGIPYVEKLLLDAYKDKGMKAGLAPIWDGVKKGIRSQDESTIAYNNIDPVTEVEEKRLGINLTANNSEEYFNYKAKKAIEYRNKNGVTAPQALQDKWSAEITDKLAQEKSYDLPKVLRIYAMTVLAYKHKARVEDNIRLAQNVLAQQREYERTSDGQIKTEAVTGKASTKTEATSFTNTKKQLDYFIKTFYGKTKDDEGVTKQLVLTSEEKKKKKELEELKVKTQISKDAGTITDEQFNESVAEIDSQIANLGEKAVWSKRGDSILKYIQLKGMGWNFMSSIANIGFGYISNRIEASAGVLYTAKELRQAYQLMGGSLVKNWTFNKVETESAKKIRTLMDSWDVLKDSTHELFQSPLDIELGKGKEWLSPYSLIQRTEYLNQAPIMVAMMLHTEVDTVKGRINLWKGYDKNGKWNESEYGKEPKEDIKKLRIKLDQTNKMNHGNYDPTSSLAIKDKFWGRAVSQFRTWMFEGYATRMEGEKYDKALDMVRKGRYISAKDFFNEVGILQGSLSILKGLIKDATFGKVFGNMDFGNFESETFKEVDVQNMKRLMTEVMLLLSINGAYLMMSMFAEGLDDEEDKTSKYIMNSLMNQGLRLKTDIMFYLHPGEFRNLLRDLVPATTLIKDSLEWVGAVQNVMIGEDEINTGVYSGHSKIVRETAQMLPFGSQVYKTINYGVQNFDK